MAISSSPLPNQNNALAGDVNAIAALRNRAAADPRAVTKEAAKQFEAMFMQELMKSMRESTMASGMLDNGGTKMGNEMLDSQFAKQMSGLKGGLSEVIERQLQRQLGGETLAGIASSVSKAAAGTGGTPAAGGTAAAADAPLPASLQGKERQVGFLRRHGDAAKAAEAETGIPATFMMAQAAHESGWGRREIKNADGTSAHNVFGIKAGPSWKGATTDITTTEVINGQAQKVKAKFRAYASYEESFRDYAQMMKNNPRYAKVVESGASAQGFAKGLQRAGYATDPEYADKLTRMINTTLRLQRASA
jgi:flagellar protein FlgJ